MKRREEKRAELARLTWVYCLPEDVEGIIGATRKVLLDVLDLVNQSDAEERVRNAIKEIGGA